MADSEWVLLIQDDRGDYYAGHNAALYRNGARVWEGYSADAVEDIVRAIVGDAIEVRRCRWEAFPNRTDKGGVTHFVLRLSEQPEPKGR